MSRAYNNPFSHGFFRCAAASPTIALGQPAINALRQLEIVAECHKQHVGVVVFPELSLTGYSLNDLFHQQCIVDSGIEALQQIIDGSTGLTPLIITGLPLMLDSRLFNCAAVVHQGRLLGVIPKTSLPNHREFYEKRQFCSSIELQTDRVAIGQHSAPIGTNLLFCCRQLPHVQIGVEICEDLWAPLQPSTIAALAGATLICNLSASNIVVGKADFRRLLVKSNSARNICGYVYSSSGQGESTTDLAWDGHLMLAENGCILSESERFQLQGSLCTADLDLEKMHLERLRNNSFRDCAGYFVERLKSFRSIEFDMPQLCEKDLRLLRSIPMFPYIPDHKDERQKRCQEIFSIQAQGLLTRLQAAKISRLVLGISGGLDSTLALLVACRAFDLTGTSRKNILAVTMPGFATSTETRQNAINLITALGATLLEIDIRPSCLQMLKDLQHPFADGKKQYDITFENVQAGDRTSHLFRLANQHNALVLGTGDLSELALGWCTYGVGDHMSHYNVNASVPKTMIRYLIADAAEDSSAGSDLREVLQKILATTISPELIPVEDDSQGSQKSESSVGPYELQDLHLYYISRFGFKPSKVAYLCWQAWKDSGKYSFAEIRHWLRIFLQRFFAASQFKRNCVPDAPKVGSGGSLSPRGDWRAPSDVAATVWLEELEKNTPADLL